MSTVAITGNTYPVKDQLKALGGRWNADRKAWMVPADKAGEAQRLVSSAPKSTYSYSGAGPRRTGPTGARRSRGTWTGCSCGSVEEYEKSSDCRSCRHDR